MLYQGVIVATGNTKYMTIKDKIKKLELQVDYIIGYKPSGHPWKAEYCLRRSLIERTHNPALQAIHEKLTALYRKLPHKQGYLRYTQQEYLKKEKTNDLIQIKEYSNGKRITRYIKPDWR